MNTKATAITLSIIALTASLFLLIYIFYTHRGPSACDFARACGYSVFRLNVPDNIHGLGAAKIDSNGIMVNGWTQSQKSMGGRYWIFAKSHNGKIEVNLVGKDSSSHFFVPIDAEYSSIVSDPTKNIYDLDEPFFHIGIDTVSIPANYNKGNIGIAIVGQEDE